MDKYLSESQIERYSRNIILEQLGGNGQLKLLDSKVLIIGAGALGSPAALYLGAAGVGKIGLIDPDKVELSNLQRQIIHNTGSLGSDKVISAADKIKRLNPDIKVETYKCKAKADNIRQIIRNYDFIIDGTDNFAAKFLINDACFFEKKPFSHAGILGFFGQLITILPTQSVCYRCIFNSPPAQDRIPSCSQAGVLGVVAGIIGTLQATEALKYILNIGKLLTNTLLTYNALEMEFRKIKLQKNNQCCICGAAPIITELNDQY